MEYRHLGRTGLKISVLTLGTMTFGGKDGFAQVGATDAAGARRLVDLAMGAGVNSIDTADVYSQGVSEEIVGSAIRGRRDQLVIGTKVRFPMGDGPNERGLSRSHVIGACEASLRRLGTDYIDLYQLHEWDGMTPLEETLSALDHLVTQGKVRYVGASNFTAWQMMKTLGVADLKALPRLVSQQIYYSLQAREAEYELIPLSLDQGLGNLIWSPLAGGLLSGKYRRGQEPPAGSRHLTAWGEPPVHDRNELDDVVDVLVEVADEHGVSPSEAALAYTLGKRGVTSLIVGARHEEQLVNNLRAADLTLDAAARARLDAVSCPRLLYPYWHQARNVSDRLSEADLSLISGYLNHD